MPTIETHENTGDQYHSAAFAEQFAYIQRRGVPTRTPHGIPFKMQGFDKPASLDQKMHIDRNGKYVHGFGTKLVNPTYNGWQPDQLVRTLFSVREIPEDEGSGFELRVADPDIDPRDADQFIVQGLTSQDRKILQIIERERALFDANLLVVSDAKHREFRSFTYPAKIDWINGIQDTSDDITETFAAIHTDATLMPEHEILKVNKEVKRAKRSDKIDRIACAVMGPTLALSIATGIGESVWDAIDSNAQSFRLVQPYDERNSDTAPETNIYKSKTEKRVDEFLLQDVIDKIAAPFNENIHDEQTHMIRKNMTGSLTTYESADKTSATKTARVVQGGITNEDKEKLTYNLRIKTDIHGNVTHVGLSIDSTDPAVYLNAFVAISKTASGYTMEGTRRDDSGQAIDSIPFTYSTSGENFLTENNQFGKSIDWVQQTLTAMAQPQAVKKSLHR